MATKNRNTAGRDRNRSKVHAKARGRMPIKASAGKQETTAHRVRRMVVRNPDLSFEQVAKRVEGKHKVGGHVWNLWNHTKSVMQFVAK